MEVGSAEDTWLSLWGLLAGDLQSGQVPCVLLPKLPAASATILDPTLFHYGLFASDVLEVTGVTGTEGDNEIVRLGSGTFEGLT